MGRGSPDSYSGALFEDEFCWDQVSLFGRAVNEPLVCNRKAKEKRIDSPGFIAVLRLNDLDLDR